MYHKIMQLTLLQLFSVIVSWNNVKSTGCLKIFYDNNFFATSSIILNTKQTTSATKQAVVMLSLRYFICYLEEFFSDFKVITF